MRDAAAERGIDANAAETAAEGAELTEAAGDSVRFRHPLIRAAVYHGVSEADRRRAHHWLARASGRDGDPDVQVWHRAAAAAEPDEPLAADLKDAADRARHRGALSATAALLRRSVALTPDQSVRARREVAVADAELVIGHRAPPRRLPAMPCPGCPMTALGARRKGSLARRCSPRAATSKPPMSWLTRQGRWQVTQGKRRPRCWPRWTQQCG